MPSAYRAKSCGTHERARPSASSRRHSRTGRPAKPTTRGSRSNTINRSRIAPDPADTCRPVVDDHHNPGPHRRPGTTGNADTGSSPSNATTNTMSAHRCRTTRPATSSGGTPVFNAATVPRLLPGHTDTVEGVAFSPSGLLATTGHDRTVRLWNPTTGEPIGDPLYGSAPPPRLCRGRQARNETRHPG